MTDRALIRTRTRFSIPRGVSYPVGAELLSGALLGVPQFDRLTVCYYAASRHKPKALRDAAEKEEAWEVFRADYLPFVMPLARYDDRSDPDEVEESWELTVYPVLSGEKLAARGALLEFGLPAVRSWLERPREETWKYHRKSIVVSFRSSDGQALVERS